MKLKIFSIFAFLFLLSCKKNTKQPHKEWITISERVQYFSGDSYLELKSGKFSYKIPKNKLPFKKIMLLNSSLTGYFLELKLEDKIVGVASPEYIYSEKIHQLVHSQKIANIGNDQKYDIEKILATKPDAIFTNYIESFENTYDILRKNGIEVLFIDEYKEQNPLDKSEIILFVGEVMGKEQEAKNIFSNIEKNYNDLKNLAQKQTEKPLVLVNEMYGNQWFLAGGKTFSAKYLEDAGANYILKDNEEDTSIPMSFEEVFVKAENAKYWVNVSQNTKKDLLAIQPNYAKMKVFQNGEIYSLTGSMRGVANDFFESGAVRADLVLRDYIKVFHKDLLKEYPLVYLKEVK